jgi:predicted amidohydrolase
MPGNWKKDFHPMRNFCLLSLGAIVFLSCGRFAGNRAPDLSRGGTVRMATVQFSSVAGTTLATNEAKAEKLIREAAGRGARYILFPECYALFPGGAGLYGADQIVREAQFVPGPLTDHVQRLCRELRVYVGVGMAERRGDGKLYNSVVYVGPEGVEGVYSKRVNIHLAVERAEEETTATLKTEEETTATLTTDATLKTEQNAGPPAAAPRKPPRKARTEAMLFAPGTSDGVLTWGGIRIGTLICADGGFHNLWDAQMPKGVQVLCWPANSAGIEPTDPKMSAASVARKYKRPVLLSNHFLRRFIYIGNSQIIDAEGNVLARAGAKEDEILVAGITLPPAPEARRRQNP